MQQDLQQLSDEVLVARCLERNPGDDRPFAELFRRYRRLVWGVCFRYFQSPEDLADRVQEVFFRAYRNLQGYRGGEEMQFRAWLVRIAVNICKNELRRRSRRPQSKEDGLESVELVSSDDPGRNAEQVESLSRLRRAIDSLSKPQREILEMADLQLLSYAEIAAEQGLSLSAVKMRVLRARAVLAVSYREIEEKRPDKSTKGTA